MPQSSSTPAILVGSAMIAAAVYFGLRAQGGAPSRSGSEPTSAGTAEAPPPVAAPPPPAVPAGAPQGPSAEARAKATADATKALEALRPQILKTCWVPAMKANAQPAAAKYVFSLSFDPSGKELARGINEDRSASRPDVAQCMRQMPIGLVIAPPGVAVSVDAPLNLP